eukprot:132901-Prymnesium_polylepis.1
MPRCARALCHGPLQWLVVTAAAASVAQATAADPPSSADVSLACCHACAQPDPNEEKMKALRQYMKS